MLTNVTRTMIGLGIPQGGILSVVSWTGQSLRGSRVGGRGCAGFAAPEQAGTWALVKEHIFKKGNSGLSHKCKIFEHMSKILFDS